MSTYAVITDDVVSNVIIWDGETPLEIGVLVDLTDHPGVGIGWSYTGGQFAEPPTPPDLDDTAGTPELPDPESPL